MNRPTIVFVFSREGTDTSTRYGGFARRLVKSGNFPEADVKTVALENLIYHVSYDKTSVVDARTGFDLGDAQFVYLKSWSSLADEAVALAHYLFAKGVPFADMLAHGRGQSKLVTLFKQWAAGNHIPQTLYCHNQEIIFETRAIDLLGERFIMKDVYGTKGQNNYLVTVDEAKQILEEEKNEDINYLFQSYIPNDGDYRVGVYGGVSKFVLKRVSDQLSHLNNISAGGRGELLATEDAPERLLNLAKRAAAASELQFAGVDIIQDKHTKKWYILEVNQGSQIVTGAYASVNSTLFNDGLRLLMRQNMKRRRSKPRKIIGRRAIAILPELNIESVVAKIDTGAYSSTLHAENIHIEKSGVVKELVFDIVPGEFIQTKSGKAETHRVRDFYTQKVRSSNGHIQVRYTIKTKISLDNIRFMASITLSDRSAMGYPLLIGRKLLRSRFIVNVELNEQNEIDWKY